MTCPLAWAQNMASGPPATALNARLATNGLPILTWFVSNTHVGVSNTHVVVSKTHVGVSNPHVGVSTTHVGVSKTHVRVSNTHAGVSITGRRMWRAA